MSSDSEKDHIAAWWNPLLTLDRLGFMWGISFQSDFICCILRITTTTLSEISSTQPGKEFWGPTSYSACRDASLCARISADFMHALREWSGSYDSPDFQVRLLRVGVRVLRVVVGEGPEQHNY